MKNLPEYQARCDLAAAHRLAVVDNLNEGTWNHFSLMLPDNPEHMLITPGDTHWSQIKASDLVVMGPNAEIIAGAGKPNDAAWIIHYPVHVARPDALCLLHVHTPYATALGMRKDCKLDTRSSQQAAMFHDDVAYFDVFDGVLREAEEGERMAAALGAKRILILRNHGVLVAAPTVARAYLDLYTLERACMFQLLAMGDGVELNRIPEDVAAAMGEYARNNSMEGHFQGMKKVLDQREPDYVN
jgi:ribulose-5-phosphate 4-epimerase/fuculose-1-phosphate aldolase